MVPVLVVSTWGNNGVFRRFPCCLPGYPPKSRKNPWCLRMFIGFSMKYQEIQNLADVHWFLKDLKRLSVKPCWGSQMMERDCGFTPSGRLWQSAGCPTLVGRGIWPAMVKSWANRSRSLRDSSGSMLDNRDAQLVGGFNYPSETWKSIGMMTFPTYGKITMFQTTKKMIQTNAKQCKWHTQMLHGAGIFTDIYPQNGPVL